MTEDYSGLDYSGFSYTISTGWQSWGQQFGWTCPKCGAVYSPTMIECWRCNQQLGTTAGDSSCGECCKEQQKDAD